MAQTQVYEGVFQDIIARYGAELAKRRVRVIIEDVTEDIESPIINNRPFYETATSATSTDSQSLSYPANAVIRNGVPLFPVEGRTEIITPERINQLIEEE